MRIVAALAGVVGLAAGALVVAVPTAVAMQPLEQGGKVAFLVQGAALGEGTLDTTVSGSYTAIGDNSDKNVFAISADTGYLERIKSDDDPDFDIPDEAKNKRILSLDSFHDNPNSVGAVAVLTEEPGGVPALHVWGKGFADLETADLTTADDFGGTPVEVAVFPSPLGVGGMEVGIRLGNGKLGILDASGYRVINETTLPEEVEQLAGTGTPGYGLLLRLANGGVLNWQPSELNEQGAVIVPNSALVAGRTPDNAPGSVAELADPLIDIQGSFRTIAVGVTDGGHVYSMNLDGSSVQVSDAIDTAVTGADLTGKPVQAAAIVAAPFNASQWLVLTNEDELYSYGPGFGGMLTAKYQAAADQLAGKEILAISGGVDKFQAIYAEPEAAETSIEVSGAGSTTTDASVTWTATVSADSGTPTGTVTASADGMDDVTGTLDGEGKVSLTLPAGLSVGAHSVTVSYAGAEGFAESSTTKTLTVSEPEDAETSVDIDGAGSTTAGTSVTWDVTVSAESGTPTGSVTASADGMTDVTEDLVDGEASLMLPSDLSVGDHEVTVSYSGADGFAESSTTKTLTVSEPEDVATSLTVAGPASTTGASVTWTATVTAESGTPTGQVTATGPGINVTGNLDGSGKASLVLPAGLSVGSHTVTVSYAGDDGFAPAESVTKTLTVSAPPIVKTTPVVALKVTKKPTMKKAGKATVTVTGGTPATGKVTVTVTGKVMKGKKAKKKTFTVTGVVKNGVVVVKIKKIKKAKGKWTLTAAYAGDATHNLALSKPVKIKVKKK